MQIILASEVGSIVFAHVVVNQRYGHDEGHMAVSMEVDDLKEFLFSESSSSFCQVTSLNRRSDFSEILSNGAQYGRPEN